LTHAHYIGCSLARRPRRVSPRTQRPWIPLSECVEPLGLGGADGPWPLANAAQSAPHEVSGFSHRTLEVLLPTLGRQTSSPPPLPSAPPSPCPHPSPRCVAVEGEESQRVGIANEKKAWRLLGLPAILFPVSSSLALSSPPRRSPSFSSVSLPSLLPAILLCPWPAAHLAHLAIASPLTRERPFTSALRVSISVRELTNATVLCCCRGGISPFSLATRAELSDVVPLLMSLSRDVAYARLVTPSLIGCAPRLTEKATLALITQVRLETCFSACWGIRLCGRFCEKGDIAEH